MYNTGMKYAYIVNPKTGRKVKTTGKLGKEILKMYVRYLTGGAGPLARAAAQASAQRRAAEHDARAFADLTERLATLSGEPTRLGPTDTKLPKGNPVWDYKPSTGWGWRDADPLAQEAVQEAEAERDDAHLADLTRRLAALSGESTRLGPTDTKLPEGNPVWDGQGWRY